MGICFLRCCEDEDKLYGQADVPLSNVGRERAHFVRGVLADMKFDLIICSPLDRAHETAMITLGDKGIPVNFDDRIIERSCGDLEGAAEPEEYWDIEKGNEYPFAEQLPDFIARIHDFLYKTCRKYGEKNILIVSHGGVSAAVNCYFEKAFDILKPGELKEFRADGEKM